MGYLSFQIIFFLLLAALLGFVIGWLLRGSRFQSELQDLDGRWRTKLGEVESERDRFVTDLTHANDAKAKAETEFKRLSETHESDLQTLKRDHQTELAALTNAEKSTAGLTSDLAARNDELSKARSELAKAQQSGGDAGRLGKELAAASERTATLESSLRDAKTAQTNCRREVDRLQAEIVELKRNAGAGGAGTASSGGALGLMSSSSGGGDTIAGGGGADNTGGSAGGAGQASGTRSDAGGSTGSTGGGAGYVSGSGTSGSSSGGGHAGGDSAGSSGGAGGSTGSSSGGVSNASTGGSSGGAGYDQRAAAPSYLADAGGQGFSGRETPSAGSSSGASGAGTGEEEGVRPAALGAARDGRADDLKRISGVGPKLEKTLNGLGIFHFSQIAEFTPDNVAWVDRHLRFKGRIERENWIEQAKVLATGAETEFSKRQ